MKIRLPEKKFFTVAELAARWEVSPSDVEHQLDTGELPRADKLAALAGKRTTVFVAAKENPFAKFPEDFIPGDVSGFIDWESGTRVFIGFHDKGTLTHSIFAYDPNLKFEETTDRNIYRELEEGFPQALETVVLIEDVLAFESKYAEQERTVSTSGEATGNIHKSDMLQYLNQAAHRFWADKDPKDRASHPTNNEIAKWLVCKGFSQTIANKAATIIRPEWAVPGRKPDK